MRTALLPSLAWLCIASVTACSLSFAPAPTPGLSLIVTPSLQSPQPVGTTVTWHAVPRSSQRVFRFAIATRQEGPYTVVRDFSPSPSFAITRLDSGRYFVRVTGSAGYGSSLSDTTIRSFRVLTRSAHRPSVSATRDPLVALFSTPACRADTVRVVYRARGTNAWSRTGSQRCSRGHTRQFLVAGLFPKTTYRMTDIVTEAGHASPSSILSFTTGSADGVTLPRFSVVRDITGKRDQSDEVVHMLTPVGSRSAANPVGTTVPGRVNWFIDEKDLTDVWPVRIQETAHQTQGARIFLFGSDGRRFRGDNPGEDVFRIVDLAGDTLQQTDIQALNVQLRRRHDAVIYGFSHDALPLPGGKVAIIAFIARRIAGKSAMGDMVLVIDRNLQVIWTWNAFHHLGTGRPDPLRETCIGFPSWACPVPEAPNVLDWTHANALSYSDSDGDLLLSLRNQDWILKIDYDRGHGDGGIIWRLGKDGDFSLRTRASTIRYPWFSHQHSAAYVSSSAEQISLFDNGNTRCVRTSQCANRGQLLSISSGARKARLMVNINLPCKGLTLGSMEALANGNYYFDCGHYSLASNSPAHEIETRPNGKVVFQMNDGAPSYRSYRASSIYAMP